MAHNMNIDQSIINDYSQNDLVTRFVEIVGGIDNLNFESLTKYDEMHVGSYVSTDYLFDALPMVEGQKWIDLGCGIGGAARRAAKRGLNVTAIDLTPNFIDAAKHLTEMVGMREAVSYEVCSVTDISYHDNTFDGAYTIHAGMNVEDKLSFFSEAYRIIKPHSYFGIFDLMLSTDKLDIIYPMPWATHPRTSFISTRDHYIECLIKAGFEIVSVEERGGFAKLAMDKVVSNFGSSRASLRGEDFIIKAHNLRNAIAMQHIMPLQIIARKAD
jgi:ubiquinone/menaquinone biosynthesis C-methylase UbiE